MPYSLGANYRDEDVQAIIAYLRTVPGIEHRVPASEPPIVAPSEPEPPLDLSRVWSPEPGSPNYDSAMRGRYIAVNLGACIECHSPVTNTELLYGVDVSAAFAGGRPFPLAAMGFPSPPFPEMLLSPNVTSDATGLGGWTAEQLTAVLRQGVQPTGSTICPPMPVGPGMAFSGLTDPDVQDIVNYIMSLPPIANETVDGCALPTGPPPGEQAPPGGP